MKELVTLVRRLVEDAARTHSVAGAGQVPVLSGDELRQRLLRLGEQVDAMEAAQAKQQVLLPTALLAVFLIACATLAVVALVMGLR